MAAQANPPNPFDPSFSYENDKSIFLFTSLTAGSSHIVSATARMETILKANRITYYAIDCATDEKARRIWTRRGAGKRLPGLVKEGMVLGDLEKVEEWNEFGEIKMKLGGAPLPKKVIPARPSPASVTKKENAPPAKPVAVPTAPPLPPVNAEASKDAPEARINPASDSAKPQEPPGQASLASEVAAAALKRKQDKAAAFKAKYAAKDKGPNQANTDESSKEPVQHVPKQDLVGKDKANLGESMGSDNAESKESNKAETSSSQPGKDSSSGAIVDALTNQVGTSELNPKGAIDTPNPTLSPPQESTRDVVEKDCALITEEGVSKDDAEVGDGDNRANESSALKQLGASKSPVHNTTTSQASDEKALDATDTGKSQSQKSATTEQPSNESQPLVATSTSAEKTEAEAKEEAVIPRDGGNVNENAPTSDTGTSIANATSVEHDVTDSAAGAVTEKPEAKLSNEGEDARHNAQTTHDSPAKSESMPAS